MLIETPLFFFTLSCLIAYPSNQQWAATAEWGAGRVGQSPVSGSPAEQLGDLCQPHAQQLSARAPHRQRLVSAVALHSHQQHAPAAVEIPAGDGGQSWWGSFVCGCCLLLPVCCKYTGDTWLVLKASAKACTWECCGFCLTSLSYSVAVHHHQQLSWLTLIFNQCPVNSKAHLRVLSNGSLTFCIGGTPLQDFGTLHVKVLNHQQE